MNNKAKKKSKDDVIRVRVSEEEKGKYTQAAKNLNMNLSQYILASLRQKNLIDVVGVRELVKEMYNINQTISRMEQKLNVPSQQLRDAITYATKSITAYADEIRGDNNVNSKI